MQNKSIHFSPATGWMNDPNGLIKIQDTYHIFYQYYPDDIVWGPMHWGHAVSKDLINWEHLPIAIYPDKDLYIFSGSCILDTENVSSLSDGTSPVLIAFYTSHDKNTCRQEQCIAYSNDYINFKKYEKNPIISNSTLPDFRDPKVIKNPITLGYSMVLAAGRYIMFYHSDNLIDWTLTGKLQFDQYGYSGIVECPDLFPIICDGKQKWVLSASIVIPDDWSVTTPSNEIANLTPHFTQYFIGEFDGYTFIPDEEVPITKFLDYGTDNYAGVTFANCDESILMSWGENWKYINDTKRKASRGKLTLARRLKLCRHNKEYYLQAAPVLPESKSLICSYLTKDFSEKDFTANPAMVDINFDNDLKVSIENIYDESFVIEVSPDSITIDRSTADDKAFSNTYSLNSYSKKVVSNPNIKNDIQIIIDNGFFEIFTNDGTINFTMNTYPKCEYSKIKIYGNAQAKIYEL